MSKTYQFDLGAFCSKHFRRNIWHDAKVLLRNMLVSKQYKIEFLSKTIYSCMSFKICYGEIDGKGITITRKRKIQYVSNYFPPANYLKWVKIGSQVSLVQ